MKSKEAKKQKKKIGIKKFLLIISVIIVAELLNMGIKVLCRNQDFVDITWEYDGGVCGESLRLGKNGSFSYHCQCGEPIDDSDLISSYVYDPIFKTIRASSIFAGTIKFDILEKDKNHLMLSTSEGVKCFTPYDEEFGYLNVPTEASPDSYATGGYGVVGKNGDKVTLAMLREAWDDDKGWTMNIDANVTYEYKLSKNAVIQYAEYDDNENKFAGEYYDDESYTDIVPVTDTEIGQMLGQKDVFAAVWLNKKLEITKIIFVRYIY